MPHNLMISNSTKLSSSSFSLGQDINNSIENRDIPRDFLTIELNNDTESSPSYYSEKIQYLWDETLYNNNDIITANKSYKKLKDYEIKYNSDSETFYDRWIKGEIPSNPEFHDWMYIYKNLFPSVNS